ncbi:hypothetical protein Cgig2_011872 [Carnegiea gigantea]|uniref:Uncharacterized protein n=1 Tax=Carnegiea gigantea TaxID=171969 RepID=A0A9Q1QED6_9CARY|nr:hypothetical protein Cgig2_011872 [Carnegiea gigantea]
MLSKLAEAVLINIDVHVVDPGSKVFKHKSQDMTFVHVDDRKKTDMAVTILLAAFNHIDVAMNEGAQIMNRDLQGDLLNPNMGLRHLETHWKLMTFMIWDNQGRSLLSGIVKMVWEWLAMFPFAAMTHMYGYISDHLLILLRCFDPIKVGGDNLKKCGI